MMKKWQKSLVYSYLFNIFVTATFILFLFFFIYIKKPSKQNNFGKNRAEQKKEKREKNNEKNLVEDSEILPNPLSLGLEGIETEEPFKRLNVIKKDHLEVEDYEFVQEKINSEEADTVDAFTKSGNTSKRIRSFDEILEYKQKIENEISNLSIIKSINAAVNSIKDEQEFIGIILTSLKLKLKADKIELYLKEAKQTLSLRAKIEHLKVEHFKSPPVEDRNHKITLGVVQGRRIFRNFRSGHH